MKSQVCRGGSADLYGLLMKSEATSQYMNKNKLQIVSGLGHTFIRFKDDEYKRFLYIDPTIAQFDPSFEGIFVGDEQDLYDIQKKQKNLTGYKLNINNYIEPTPKIFSFFTKRKRPPLTIEKQLMNNALDDGRRSRRKRIIKNALDGGPLFTKKLPPSTIEEQFMNNALDDVPISRGKRTIKNENNSLYGGSRSRRRRTIKKRTD
jgi:hypothetical protein